VQLYSKFFEIWKYRLYMGARQNFDWFHYNVFNTGLKVSI